MRLASRSIVTTALRVIGDFTTLLVLTWRKAQGEGEGEC